MLQDRQDVCIWNEEKIASAEGMPESRYILGQAQPAPIKIFKKQWKPVSD